MSNVYPSMPHLNGHLLCAIDFETTGKRPGYHEPIQIAVVPLDDEFAPIETVRPFYMNMKPDHPLRAQRAATRSHGLDIDHLCKTALDSGRVHDLFIEWFENLELPHKRVMVPLAHNWAFERSFLNHWLGVDLTDSMFHAHARDTMNLAIAMNDMCFFRGERPIFQRVNLGYLCRELEVVNKNPHDALCDCLAEAEVYRKLVNMDIL